MKIAVQVPTNWTFPVVGLVTVGVKTKSSFGLPVDGGRLSVG